MGALFQIVAYSIGNLFLGILLTVVGVILLFVLIQSWYRNSTFTPVSYIVGGILFLFLSFQSILLCGAVTIKSYSEDVEGAINSWVAEVPSDIPFNQEDSQHVLEQITEEWPLVGYFVGGADFTGHTSVTIAQAMAEELRSFMNYFILRRGLEPALHCLWSGNRNQVDGACFPQTLFQQTEYGYRQQQEKTL